MTPEALAAAEATHKQADQANQAMAAQALIRAMLARDFWTAERILARWATGSEGDDLAFSAAVTVSACSVILRMAHGDRDRALAEADAVLDLEVKLKAPQTRAA